MRYVADERQIGLGYRRTKSFLAGILHDLILAGRLIVRRPGFALIVVITLAVGIGPNVAIFSVIKAMMLEPLPYPEPDRLVQVWESPIESVWQQGLSYPDYIDLRNGSSSFDAFGVFSPRSYNIGDGEPVRVEGNMATAGVLKAYGIKPTLGRFFTHAEVEDGSRVVILSAQLWRERYNSDPEIVGTTATINGEAHVVVGVMPAGAVFLSPWTRAGDVKLWTPLEIPPSFAGPEGRGIQWLLAIGRLKQGVEWKAAEAELKIISAGLQQQYPESNAGTTVWINPFLRQIVGRMSGQIMVLLGAVGLVLLIAVANVASLLLARGAGRQQEVAIRASLGAGRARIFSQQLMESLLLSLLGGAAGLLLGYWSISFLRTIIPASIRWDRVGWRSHPVCAGPGAPGGSGLRSGTGADGVPDEHHGQPPPVERHDHQRIGTEPHASLSCRGPVGGGVSAHQRRRAAGQELSERAEYTTGLRYRSGAHSQHLPRWRRR
jgi:predicted permease